jgi:hypothetical protein
MSGNGLKCQRTSPILNEIYRNNMTLSMSDMIFILLVIWVMLGGVAFMVLPLKNPIKHTVILMLGPISFVYLVYRIRMKIVKDNADIDRIRVGRAQ